MRRVLALLYCIPVVAIAAMSAMASEPTVVLLSGGAACLIVAIATSGWIIVARASQRRLWPAILGSGVCVFTLVSVIVTDWPLRLSYSLSRPSMDRLAAEVRAGAAPARLARVGLISIERTELSPDGIVCLWTATDPSGRTGFVRCRPDHVPFNLWSIVRLDQDWQFISED